MRDVRLERATDEEVWNFARRERYVIVSKDSDFYARSILTGAPPKVIWIQRGNCSTQNIERILRRRFDDIRRFGDDTVAAFLVLT